MLPIEIRKATKADVPRIIQLWKSLMAYHVKYFGYGRGIFEYKKNKLALYKRFITKRLRARNAAVFVAEADGRVLGHAMVSIRKLPPIYAHDREAYVDEVVVDKRHRGIGVGTKLLKEAEKWAKKKKLYSLGLVVHEKNRKAFSAYKSFGFLEHHLNVAKKVR